MDKTENIVCPQDILWNLLANSVCVHACLSQRIYPIVLEAIPSKVCVCVPYPVKIANLDICMIYVMSMNGPPRILEADDCVYM